MFVRTPSLMQVAYVVDDLDAAIERWTSVFRIGPFRALRNVKYTTATYRGRSIELEMDLAFGYSGDLQIELMCQLDSGPSLFREFLGRGGFGAQHLGAVSDDFDADLKRLIEAGALPVQHLCTANGGEVAYLEPPSQSGEIVELIRGSAGLHERFAGLRRAAADWDGVGPCID